MSSLFVEMYEMRLKRLLIDEEQYTFPEFVRMLREVAGITREGLAGALGCSITRLNMCETGTYRHQGPKKSFIGLLAQFYGIDARFLQAKLDQYLESQKGKVA